MSTANKLTYLNTTKTKLKDMINYGLDNDNKITDETTFRNYNNSLFNAYIETINDPSTLYNNLPKVSGSGIDITLNNTKETRMELKLKGNTYQETTTGKQLFNVNAIQGSQVTWDSEGWITSTYDNTGGTEGIYKNLFTTNLNLNTSTTYAIILEVKNVTSSVNPPTLTLTNNHSTSQSNTNVSVPFNQVSNNGVYKYTFTTKSDFTGTANGIRSYVSYPAGRSGSITFRISVLADTSITPQTFTYEPFTNGASPNPGYPQDIEVVTGGQNVKIQNKNLINSVEYNKGLNTSGGFVTNNQFLGIEDYVKIQPNTTYTISFEHDNTSKPLYLGYKTGDGTFISRTWQDSRTFTTPNNACYLFAYVYNPSGFSTIGGWVQLEIGSQKTSYVSHQEQNYEINLGSLELCKIGTYQDYIYKSDSDWKIHREIGKVVLDGQENWQTLSGVSYNSYYVDSLISANRTNDTAPYLSNNFKPITNNQRYVNNTFFINSNNRIIISYNDITSSTNFKTWLSTHNTNVYYVLATATDETITNEALIEQLNNLYYATSYEEQTNVNSNGNLASLLNANAIQDLSE